MPFVLLSRCCSRIGYEACHGEHKSIKNIVQLAARCSRPNVNVLKVLEDFLCITDFCQAFENRT